MTDPHADDLEIAIQLAVAFHAGQRDKAGACYVLHLFRVMHACGDGLSAQAAVLHDILEDTRATAEDLIRSKLRPEVIEAVLLLTKPEAMTYEDYIVRLASNPIAKQVKIADLQDNYRLDRVAYREDSETEDRQRLQRYILAHQFLTGAIPLEMYRRRASRIA